MFHTELHVVPKEYPVFITEPILNPKGNREKMAQIMFETFEVPFLYIGIESILSLYTPGRSTGIVVESGDGVTQIVPIYEGYVLSNAIQRMDFGGGDVTNYLAKLISKPNSCSFATTAERHIVRDIKEKCCYAAIDYDKEPSNEKSYTIPDGQDISLGRERFTCTEALFKPNELLGLEFSGIHNLIHSSIMKCDIDVRSDLYRNIILSGGNTLFQGFPERLEKEMSSFFARPKIIAPPERKYSVWIGANILASLLTSHMRSWVSRQQYYESGPTIVHHKFQ